MIDEKILWTPHIVIKIPKILSTYTVTIYNLTESRFFFYRFFKNDNKYKNVICYTVYGCVVLRQVVNIEELH